MAWVCRSRWRWREQPQVAKPHAGTTLTLISIMRIGDAAERSRVHNEALEAMVVRRALDLSTR
jgi:hypothetical protein